MTQIMQPDIGEFRLPSHFFPNPIQSFSAVSSSRKHKFAAIGFQSEIRFYELSKAEYSN